MYSWDATDGPSGSEILALYPDRNELEREYPELEPEDIRQALVYAAANLEDKVLELHGA